MVPCVCRQDGVTESGVTVAFTVLAMDAGPIIAQQKVPVDNSVKVRRAYNVP